MGISMFDIRLLRKDPELVKHNLRRRGDVAKLSWVDEVLVLDRKWRKTLTEINQLREKRNIITEEVSTLKKQGKDACYN